MCKYLRDVTFRILCDGYMPNRTPQEKKDAKEDSQERHGFFHRWVEEVDTSGDIPRLKPMALVEDADTGHLYVVDYFNVQFTEDRS